MDEASYEMKSGRTATSDTGMFRALLEEHHHLLCLATAESCPKVVVDGHSLTIASVLAVSRYLAVPELPSDAKEAILRSQNALTQCIDGGQIIYGLNTGFGGSANTRTTHQERLSKDLLTGLLYGIVNDDSEGTKEATLTENDLDTIRVPLALDHGEKTYMPESWVRASMLLRLNSLARGVSGVSLSTASSLCSLIVHDIVPRIPIRGSISASGDLSPLAYIAGMLIAKSSIYCWAGSRAQNKRTVKPANMCLDDHGIPRLTLGPKEGLALVNGTSVSAALGALVMHEAINLAALAQILTAMSVEALQGTDESFDPVFAKVRPHWGQEESGRSIASMLKDSKLVARNRGSTDSSLRQDRYSIRTASQWMGPVLEDMELAFRQVTVELNSATDNPLCFIDPDDDKPRVIHGGNFQARSITSAMEKVRQSSQSLGRLLFTQCSEMINPATSRGLPPNLVIGEPSEAFIFKGTDILVAALLSELGFLANPVGSHVQTAEMGNQALNSLALISARYTLDSLDILAQLAAAHLVAVCQALDLRAFTLRYLTSLQRDVRMLIIDTLDEYIADSEYEVIEDVCWKAFLANFDTTSSLDSPKRIATAVGSAQMTLLSKLPEAPGVLTRMKVWAERFEQHAYDLFNGIRNDFLIHPNAAPLLGKGTRRMYQFVRGHIGIPFVGPDTLATPEEGASKNTVTMGDLNGRVRAAMSDGSLYRAAVECLAPSNY